MSDGIYSFKNSELTLSFKVDGDGYDIYNVILTYHSNGQKEYGTGQWFKVNMNGVDPDYSGPNGWYQFQTSRCNYSFNETTNKLTLEQYDCTQNPTKKFSKITLTRQY
jgi:hypothetical protein